MLMIRYVELCRSHHVMKGGSGGKEGVRSSRGLRFGGGGGLGFGGLEGWVGEWGVGWRGRDWGRRGGWGSGKREVEGGRGYSRACHGVGGIEAGFASEV